MEWGGTCHPQLEVRDYRVRCSAHAMDAAHDGGVRFAGDPVVDRYLLQFWPAPPAPDQVVRQTSRTAASWHEHARSVPPPPAPPTPDELAALRRREEREADQRRRRMDIDHFWGGVAPSERLFALGGGAAALARLDRPLLEAIDDAGSEVQRRVARWAARRACDAAGVLSLDWVSAALDALDRGDDLPPPLDASDDRAMRLLVGGDVGMTSVVATVAPDEHLALPPLWPPAAAVAAIRNAVEEAPLQAAVLALGHAAITAGDGHPALFRALREAFFVPPR